MTQPPDTSWIKTTRVGHDNTPPTWRDRIRLRSKERGMTTTDIHVSVGAKTVCVPGNCGCVEPRPEWKTGAWRRFCVVLGRRLW